MYTLKLRYGETLLLLIQREASRAAILRRPIDRHHVDGLCDRFELLMASLRITPLVWQGDDA